MSSYFGTIVPEYGMQAAVAGVHKPLCMTTDEDGIQIAVGVHETSGMTTEEDGMQIAVGVHETSCMTTEEDGIQIAVGVHETSYMTTEQNMHVPILLLYNQCRRQRPILPFCWLNTAQLA